MFLQPGKKLDRRVRIGKPGDLPHLPHQVLLTLIVKNNGAVHQFFINQHSTVVDPLAHMIFVPDGIRHRILLQPVLDSHRRDDVPAIVGAEGRPFLRCVFGPVDGTVPVRLRRPAGNAEEADQVTAFRHLLFRQMKCFADRVKRERKSQVCGPYHAALPSFRIEVVSRTVSRRAVAFEDVRPVPSQPSR